MRVSGSAFASAVAEVQGLYGAFSFPEKLLQKIWLRGDFDRAAARLSDGRALRVVHPGKWNLLGGPDFTAARLRFDRDERDTNGDVEVHLRAGDWDAHGHAQDPAYDGVVLHVVLFPPAAGQVTRGAGGRAIPTLALLPLLHRALEEFAGDEAVEVLANRPLTRLPDELGLLPQSELATALRRQAGRRWSQKVHFAGVRLQRLGWDEACHHVALEILGYRFNRAPMLRIAGKHRFAAWARGAIDPDDAFAEEGAGWSLQGVRPANHPRRRLRQYAAWMRARPDWPDHARALASKLPALELSTTTGSARQTGHLGAVRACVAHDVCGDAIGGTRLDTFICDGLLPLLAPQTPRIIEPVWYHWFTGDLPPWLVSGLRQLGYFQGRAQPGCQGAAQGLLGWLLEREPPR